MTKPGMLIVFSGPSGVGKDTILRPFMQNHPECALSISVTTRAPRLGEVEGEHYHFIGRERFERLVAEGKMLEWAEYSGNCYGTPRRAVEQQLQSGKHVILEIELKGAMKIRELCPNALFVFVMPPSLAELRKRLTGRGTETPASLERRMLAAREEIKLAYGYDYIIVNHSIEESCERLGAILAAAQCSAKYMKDVIREVYNDA